MDLDGQVTVLTKFPLKAMIPTITKSWSGHPKGTIDKKKRHDKNNYKDCMTSICQAYAEELSKREKHLPTHFLDQLIKKKQLEFDTSQKVTKKQNLIA